MFQPAAKYAFVSRYCPPADGWWVYVDIDASELGETGGERRTAAAIERQQAMQHEGRQAMEQLTALGATVRGPRARSISERGWGIRQSRPLLARQAQYRGRDRGQIAGTTSRDRPVSRPEGAISKGRWRRARCSRAARVTTGRTGSVRSGAWASWGRWLVSRQRKSDDRVT